MTQKRKNPAPQCSAGTGFGLDTCGQPVSDPKHSTDTLVVQRLRRRFGFSIELAAVYAELSSYGTRMAQ
jgi:hypothetical protein